MSYLKDSNAYGNNYFAKYFEWQGVCREAWFYNCIAKDFLQPLGVLITKKANTEYIRETFPFQKIRCLVSVKNMKRVSFFLTFCFCDPKDENIVFARGCQQIVFANKERKLIKFPEEVIKKIAKYAL